MNSKERLLWLNQINRIHREQKALRDNELKEQADFLLTLQAEDQ